MTPQEMVERLRACPFCGGEAEMQLSGFGEPEWLHFTCRKCAASSGAGKNAEYAREFWNARASDALILTLQQRVHELEGVVAKAGERFREYERAHKAKAYTGGGLEAEKGRLRKAASNRRMAELCEAALPSKPDYWLDKVLSDNEAAYADLPVSLKSSPASPEEKS